MKWTFYQCAQGLLICMGTCFLSFFLILILFQSLSSFIYAGLLCVKQRKMYILFIICNGDILFHIVCGSGHLMMFVYVMPSWLFCGMQVLQCRYCNTSGSLTPLPCRVVNHCLVVQVLVRTEG